MPINYHGINEDGESAEDLVQEFKKCLWISECGPRFPRIRLLSHEQQNHGGGT